MQVNNLIGQPLVNENLPKTSKTGVICRGRIHPARRETTHPQLSVYFSKEHHRVLDESVIVAAPTHRLLPVNYSGL